MSKEADWEMTVRVSKTDADKRQSLTGGINFGICASDSRVAAGLYEVKVTRVRLTTTERRYMQEIRDTGAPAGWGLRTVTDGRKGPNIEILNRLQQRGLIEESSSLGFKLTNNGEFLLNGE